MQFYNPDSLTFYLGPFEIAVKVNPSTDIHTVFTRSVSELQEMHSKSGRPGKFDIGIEGRKGERVVFETSYIPPSSLAYIFKRPSSSLNN